MSARACLASRCTVITAFILFGLPSASATMFSVYYSSSQTSTQASVDILTTHQFVVKDVTRNRTTRWYLNGTLKQEDQSGLLGIDPRYTWTNPGGGRPSNTVRADIYETNGSFLKRFEWVLITLRPDLVVTNVQVSTLEVLPGQNIRVDAWVKNVGEGSAPQFTLSFEWDLGYEVATGLIPNVGLLSPGQEVQETVYAFTIPTFAGPGFYYISAVADMHHVTHEHNDGNNSKTSDVLVILGNVTVPDLLGIDSSVLGLLKFHYGLLLGTVTYETSDTIPAGEVIDQSLAAGSSVPVGTTIDFVVSLGPAPEIKVRTPKDGEALLLGGRRRIKWQSTDGLGGDVRIELWQNGAKVRNIKKSTSNDGLFRWRIQNDRYAAGTGYRVRIISLVDNSIQDFSNGSFSIVSN